MPFWNKDAQTRIDQTISYICGLCPQAERSTIKAYLDKMAAANAPSSATLKSFSDTLSTKGHAGVGDEAPRAARSALVLISSQINPTHPLYLAAPATMSMAQPQLIQKLNTLIPSFRTFALQEENVRTLLQSALNNLMTQPIQFLQQNLVAC